MLIIDNWAMTLLSWTTFMFPKAEKTGDLYYYKSADLSHLKIGGFVSFSRVAVLSRFQSRLFFPTLGSVASSRIRFNDSEMLV